jgi:hypothetical protein
MEEHSHSGYASSGHGHLLPWLILAAMMCSSCPEIEKLQKEVKKLKERTEVLENGSTQKLEK